MPNTLKTLQAQFQNFLIQDNPAIIAAIKSTPNFNAQDRLAVYSDAYYLRLVDILAKEFPRLKKFCGEEKFDEAAFRYLDQYPSQHYSLYRFANHFSGFLKTYFNGEPMIAELAIFERALSDVLLAGNGQRIGVQALRDLTSEQWPVMKLILHPAVQAIALTLNVPDIWRALNTEQTLPEIKSSPSAYLIWRFHQQPYFAAITPEQLRIFTAIQCGDCFAEICEDLIGHLEEEKIGAYVAGVLQQWLTSGIFTQVQIP